MNPSLNWLMPVIKNQANQNTLTCQVLFYVRIYIKSKIFLGFYCRRNQFSVTSIRFEYPAMYISRSIELIRVTHTKEKFEDFLRILKLTFYK